MEELINEFGDLNKKIEDLKTFITGEHNLNNLNRDLVVTQIKAMEAYLGILSIRIGLNAKEDNIHGQEQ